MLAGVLRPLAAVVLTFAVATCDVRDSSEFLGGSGEQGPPPDGPIILDRTCGTHVGDPSVFDAVPDLRPAQSRSILGPDPAAPRHIRLSWQSDPATSMTCVWRTDDRSESTVLRVSRTREGLADPRTRIEVSEDRHGEGIGSAHVLPHSAQWKTIHVAEVCGLDPDTSYYYQVGGRDEDGLEVMSGVYTFRTAPLPAGRAVKFVVLGDSRDAYDRFGRIMAGAARHDPDFIIHSGDMVGEGFIQDQWDAWFTAAEPVLREIPLMTGIGNHEYNAVNYFAQFAMPNNEYWYEFRYGPVQFVSLTDNEGLFAIGSDPRLTKRNTIQHAQRAFMDETFRDTDRTWKILYHHRPVYSSSSKFAHGSNADLQRAWLETIEGRQVHMVFAGHDHHYERTCPIRAGACVPGVKQGTLYVTSAGAGASLYDSTPQWFTAFSKRIHHYALVTISGRRGTIEAFDIDGNLIDSYEMSLD